jgi:YidC/Oxa1 family membrane protein insertase
MKALQERYKDDKPRCSRRSWRCTRRRRSIRSPDACHPDPDPIFFALYKVLILAIEMRHQPFALWIRDLSAPDPAHILNLFGLLPFEVPGLLAIGHWLCCWASPCG